VLNVHTADVGRPIDEIKPNVAGVDLEHQVAAVIASGRPSECEARDRQGHWYRLQVRPARDADGSVDGAILSLIDIDALKHNVADAEWARDYALDIVEAVQVPLVVLDEDLRVLSANQAFYGTFETTESSTKSQRLFELDGGQWDIPALRGPLEGLLATDGWLADLEVEHDFPRIARRVIRISASVVHSRAKVPMILLALEDITARKRADDERAELLVRAQSAREEAERANAAKDGFLAMLSHELRTPLAALLLQSQLLRRGALDAAKVHSIGDVIERSTRLQIQLIEDLLDVSRIVTGKLTITPEEVDLADVVQGAIENVSALAQTKAVRFSAELEAGIATVSADSVRMLQVFSNLLTNAIKFSAQGGRVTVALTTVDGNAAVRVTDEGRGIEPEFLPHVFDRFTQQDSSTTRVFGGLGLGLAIVRHIVDLHGGTVRAESAGAGQGATFLVTLPLVADARAAASKSPLAGARAKPSAQAPSTKGADAQLHGLRVLLVDDDAAIREATTEILCMLGASVVTKPSASEALDALERSRFDVVLCDIAMPGEDGFGFIRRLRQLDAEHGGRTPAIAFTALAGDQNCARSLEAGFQLHLSKPIDIDRLAESVITVTDTGPAPN
jgi:two-component system CheB/CheR fusion protein